MTTSLRPLVAVVALCVSSACSESPVATPSRGHQDSLSEGGSDEAEGRRTSDATSVAAPGVAANRPPTACEQIAPDPGQSAAANLATIQSCLNGEGRAWLQAGTYPIAGGLRVPAGAELRGLSSPAPTVILEKGAGSDATNFMVSLEAKAAATAPGAKTHVQALRLDANNAIGILANAATMVVGSDDALVESVDIYNAVEGPAAHTTAGIYVICESCKGNVFKDARIFNHYYGIIFRSTLTASTPNAIVGGEIFAIRCDTVTFAGYGEAIDVSIHDAGWACNNGPIPGGGLYALDNANGAKIIGNTVRDTCGHGLDLDRSSHFVVTKNHFYDPGSHFGGKYPYCAGNAAFLLDVGESTITDNVFENNGRAHNSGFDPNEVMHARGARPFSDLPAGARTVVSFVLARRPDGGPFASAHNTLERNSFRSFQDPAAGFVGLGYFTSRDSGFASDGGWGASTTNYFTANTAVGSNVGSVRCGGNWFAGASECVDGSPAPCNADDSQHSGAFHGDDCPRY